MSIRFILGRAGSGKTYYCLTELARLIKEDPHGRDLIFLVPEQATFIHERMLATDFGLSGFARVDVTSFSRLIYRATKELGLNKLPRLSRTGKMMVLAKIMLEKRADLTIFAAPDLKSGIAGALLDIIDEINIYDGGGRDLDQAIDYWQAEEGKTHFASKMADISILYREMEAFTKHKYADESEGLSFLQQAIMEKGLLKRGTYIY